MSVLIRGMNMPRNCLMCQFHGFGGYKNELIVCSLTGRSEGQLSNVPDCPLVEVPPHGRLIDRDMFESFIYERLSDPDYKTDAFDILMAVYEMPTIIEAEEGEPDVSVD